jgi:hypothetical protein
VLTPRGTEVVRHAPRERAKYGEVIFTGQLEVDRRVQLNGDGEALLDAFACPDRGIRREVTVPQEAWESRGGFKRHLPTSEFAWYGTDNDLQCLMVHLSRMGGPHGAGNPVYSASMSAKALGRRC